MYKFDVTVQRAEYREHTFTVSANSPGEAQEKALDAACDYNFLDSPVHSAKEEVVAIVMHKKEKA
jgi:hypothetical protein